MASGAVMESSSGPRPLLKGRHTLFMKKHLTIGLAYSFACVILTKLLVNEPRKKAYAEYYKWVFHDKKIHQFGCSSINVHFHDFCLHSETFVFFNPQEIWHRGRFPAHS